MSTMTIPRIDIERLKDEIRTLSKLCRHHKRTTQDTRRKLGANIYDMAYDQKLGWVHKDPAKRQTYKLYCDSGREWGKLSHRLTQLCALRAYLRGRDHFGSNSRFLSEHGGDLEKFIFPAAQEFAVSGI